MILRLLAAATLAVLPLFTPASAEAACDAPNFLDRLDAEVRAEIDAKAAATPFAEGLIWEARRGDDRLVLAGTLHLPDPRHQSLADTLRPEIRAADLLMVEITREDEARLLEDISADPSIMYLENGPALPDLLGEEVWDQVAEAARARSIPPFMVAKLRPWAAMVTLAIPPCAISDLASEAGGLDHVLMDIAAEEGTEQQSLEPRNAVPELFDEIGSEREIALLRAGLVAPELQGEMMTATFEDYFAGHIARIWVMNEAASDYVPGASAEEAREMSALVEELLIERRNRAWIERIEETMKDADRVVIAAGALHLPGEAGLLHLLEERGWTISRLE